MYVEERVPNQPSETVAVANTASTVEPQPLSAPSEEFTSASSAIVDLQPPSAPSTPTKSTKRMSVGERLQEQADKRKQPPIVVITTPEEETATAPLEEELVAALPEDSSKPIESIRKNQDPGL